MPDERPFRIRPRRPTRQSQDENRAWSKAFKALMGIVRMTSGTSQSLRRVEGSVRRARTPGIRQRCAVRITYSSNRVRGQWAAHGRYLMRESAAQTIDGPAAGFGATDDRVQVAKVLDQWQGGGDQRLFKLIVSPEFGERMDLREHTRALMRRIESDLGTRLDWVAVAHFNTDHPHVHVALRGVADGGPLRFERDYIKHGIRRHAEDLCTAQLGFRTQTDVLEAERREVDQPRWTSLDARIRRLAAVSGEALVVQDLPATDVRKHYVVARLRTLERMGLANSAPGAWIIQNDFQAALKAMQRTTDRQRMLAEHSALMSDPRLPVQYTPIRDIEVLEGRVLGHSVEEASGTAHMILEGTDAKVHLIPHSEAIQAARRQRRLAPNSFVRLSRTPRGAHRDLAVSDYGDAEAYFHAANRGNAVRNDVQWGGWLGRFLAVHEPHQVRASAERSGKSR